MRPRSTSAPLPSKKSEETCSVPKPIRGEQKKAQKNAETDDDFPSVPKARNSGFPSLVDEKPPIHQKDYENSDEELDQSPTTSNVKELEPALSSENKSLEWEDQVNPEPNRFHLQPLSNLPRKEATDYELRKEMIENKPLNPITIVTETSSTDFEPIRAISASEDSNTEIEPVPRAKPSETIPSGLFYLAFMKIPESKLSIKLINESLRQVTNNLLHFMTADGDLNTSVSQLLSDLGRISTLKIKSAKPKIGKILVTPKGKTKILTGIIAKRYFEEITLQNIRLTHDTLAKYPTENKITLLRVSKNHDLSNKVNFSSLLTMLKEALNEVDSTIYICYGNNTLPSEDLREMTIKPR